MLYLATGILDIDLHTVQHMYAWTYYICEQIIIICQMGNRKGHIVFDRVLYM